MVGKKQHNVKRIYRFALDNNIMAFFVWAVMVLTSCLLTALSAQAITSISQSYKTEETLPVGSIVSLKANTSDEVISATSKTVDAILGVVINDNSSILTLKDPNSKNVQVASSELVPVLISDINGEIKEGDPITASPIKGVGMKATNNTKIIGVAHAKPIIDNKSQAYTDDTGSQKTVKLGQVSVLINVAYYYKEPDKTIIPAALQNIANAMAGKTVETLPIIISLIIFIITVVVVVSIIYSMIRSSIISVGRNPMSQSAIYRDLIQLSALVLIILAAGMIAIYLVLTRM
jgi:hypothetical protein